MDEIDITTERISAELDRRIAAARANVPHEDGPEVCTVCDERIPIVRRRLGYQTCVPCAAQAERERALYAGRA
jgi:RNA polymerase-binding transcription factor DksA